MEVLGEYLLKAVSHSKNISLPEASKYINKCLMEISAKNNIDYDKLYDALYSFSGLSQCLVTSCSKATLDDCNKMCWCLVFNDKCVPRYIPNALEINQDPDKYALSLKTPELEDLLQYFAYLYYNYDGGGITDNSYDALEYNLKKRLKTKGRLYEKIGSLPIKKLRVKLPYAMGTLDKVKPETSELFSFLNLAKSKLKPIVWSDKLDGISGMVVYENGVLSSIYTKGNGDIGGNVTYLRDYITFPSLPSEKYLVVRGEFILSKKIWNEKYKDSYSNARGFVSAKINQGYVSEALPDIEFIAYQIIDSSEGQGTVPSQTFKILESKGFKTPVYGTLSNPLTFDLITIYRKRRDESPFNIDGLVIAIDVQETNKTIPSYSKAFKMLLEEQIRKSKAINVEWNISRYGRYVPVVIYEAVFIDGIRLHRASGHNGQHIIDWHMGKGTNLTIVRSGDVIPMIKDVIVNPNIQPILPNDSSAGGWDWDWENKDIVLKDVETNPEVHIKRILHFFETINVPGIGEGRVRKLYETGFKTIKDITLASEKDLMKTPGFGKKLSHDTFEKLHYTMKNTRMDRFFVSITTIKTRIGRTLLKQVTKFYPEIFSSDSKEIETFLKKNKIPGIGAQRIKVLAESIPKFREALMELNPEDIKDAIKNNESRLKLSVSKGFNPKIENNDFVFTGFFDNIDMDIEDYIDDNRGNIVKVVTSTTKAVVCANPTLLSGKLMKALELKVPVYTLAEFKKEFLELD